MEEFIFLFCLASVWVIFAAIQDLKTREVANWITFSLVIFALFYRLIYSLTYNSWQFLVWGVLGAGLFYILALVFYYGKVFAGGDAKLLIGMGTVMPFNDFSSLFTQTGIFILALFSGGALLSLIYGVILGIRRKKEFVNHFIKSYGKNKKIIWVSQVSILILIVILISVSKNLFFSYIPIWSILFIGVLMLILPWLSISLFALERGCLISKLKPIQLTEGDWITHSFRVRGKLIKKTVHGLTAEDIKFLKKHKVLVEVKQGIPFVPAFLIAWLFMVFFFLFLEADPLALFGF